MFKFKIPGIGADMATLIRGAMCFNLALMIRATRFGLSDARERGATAYSEIEPFQPYEQGVNRSGPRDYISFRAIPAVALEEVAGSRPLVKVDGRHPGQDGSLPLNDMVTLLCLLRDRAPCDVLEIGTFDGMTTRLMAINLPNATIHTVDLPEDFDTNKDAAILPKDDFHLIQKRRVGELFRLDTSISNVIQHYGDTASWDFSNARKAEFFFIDGAHTYEYVKSDTEKCLAIAAGRRATFLWHDCNPRHPGVVRWLAEMTKKGYPVKRITGTNLAVMDVDGDQR